MMHSNLEIIKNINIYQTKIVRDLVWTLCSKSLTSKTLQTPELPSHFYNQFYHDIKDQLLFIDKYPNEIEKNFSRKNTRLLGSYFEHLVWTLFDLHPNYEIVTFQEQIIKDTVTKGEIDFIVKNKLTNQLLHIETAIKFYLGNQSEDAEQLLWFGPNARDRLDLKFKKMIQSQIPMIQASRYNSQNIESFTWIKGGLYAPFGSDLEFQKTYETVGEWMGYSAFKKLYPQHPFPYHILDKKDWLSGIYKNDMVSENQIQPIQHHFEETKNPYAIQIQNGVNNQLLFIVSDEKKNKIMQGL